MAGTSSKSKREQKGLDLSERCSIMRRRTRSMELQPEEADEVSTALAAKKKKQKATKTPAKKAKTPARKRTASEDRDGAQSRRSTRKPSIDKPPAKHKSIETRTTKANAIVQKKGQKQSANAFGDKESSVDYSRSSAVALLSACMSVRPTCFDITGSYLCVCMGAVVRVLSVATGEEVARLVGHTAEVTSIVPVPRSAAPAVLNGTSSGGDKAHVTKCVTASMDGTMRVWALKQGTCLHTVRIPGSFPVLQVLLHTHEGEGLGGAGIYAVVKGEEKKEQQQSGKEGNKKGKGKKKGGNCIRVVQVETAWLDSGDEMDDSDDDGGDESAAQTQTLLRFAGLVTVKLCVRSTLARAGEDEGGAAGDQGSRFVVATNGNELAIWHSGQKRVRRHTHGRPLTTLCVHPTDPVVMTGDAEGAITTWHCLDNKSWSLSSNSSNNSNGGNKGGGEHNSCITSGGRHWHAHGVSALAATVDGAMLLSGGEEGVLVLWQLGTGARSFLPRLGAALSQICPSPCGTMVAVSCASNSVRLISLLTLKDAWHVQGLAIAHDCLCAPPGAGAGAGAGASGGKGGPSKAGAGSKKGKFKGKQKNGGKGEATTTEGAEDKDAATKTESGRRHHQSAQHALQQRQRHSLAPTKPPPLSALLHTGLVLEPRRRVLVLNSSVASSALQFFNIRSQEHLSELQVVPRNAVSRTDEQRAAPFRVEHVAFTPSGSHMATIDSNAHEVSLGEMRPRRVRYTMRVWRRVLAGTGAATQGAKAGVSGYEQRKAAGPESDYELVSRVEDVHTAKVTALEFHPSSGGGGGSGGGSSLVAAASGGSSKAGGGRTEQLLLVTGSHDQTFKIWEGEEAWEKASSMAGGAGGGDAGDGKKGGKTGAQKHSSQPAPLRRVTRWWCRSRGGYRQRKVSAACFSRDAQGSLLAVAVGAGVALLEPLANKLRTVLVHPPPSEPVSNVMFLPESPFLVAASAHLIQVWDTLSCTVWWSYAAHVTAVASDTMFFSHTDVGNGGGGDGERIRVHGGSGAGAGAVRGDGARFAVCVDVAAQMALQEKLSRLNDGSNGASNGASNSASNSASNGKVTGRKRTRSNSFSGADGVGGADGAKTTQAHTGSAVLLFDAASPAPLQLWHTPSHSLRHLLFVPPVPVPSTDASGSSTGVRDDARSTLLAISERGELLLLPDSGGVVFDLASSADAEADTSASMSAGRALPRLLPPGANGSASGKEFSLIGVRRLGANKRHAHAHGQGQSADVIFQAPSHAIPPLHTLYSAFMRQLLPLSSSQPSKGGKAGGNDSHLYHSAAGEERGEEGEDGERARKQSRSESAGSAKDLGSSSNKLEPWEQQREWEKQREQEESSFFEPLKEMFKVQLGGSPAAKTSNAKTPKKTPKKGGGKTAKTPKTGGKPPLPPKRSAKKKK